MRNGREVLEVDILVVGAGPAGLAAAYHLKKLLNEKGQRDRTVVVLEKGKEIGAHTMSGAILDPRGIEELIPDWIERGAPVESLVEEDDLYFLTCKRRLRFPITPPFLRNHGNYIVSLNRFVRWLGKAIEAVGVDVFEGFSASELLFEDERVVGVRIGDKGLDRNGRRKANYEPGVDIHAKITILAEGVRGSLTKKLISRMCLDEGQNPQVYAIGVKEVWSVGAGQLVPGRVIHTLGFPLSREEFGGGFLYTMDRGLVSLGMVVGLDYRDPSLDPHLKLQEFKTHPLIREILDGGRMVSYGAKAIPEGGYWAMPRSYFDGGLIIGDAGGFLNSMRLKGIHLAIKSGMLAAEAAAEAIGALDYSARQLSRFEDLMKKSWIFEELWQARNFHQGFSRGLWLGMAHSGLQMLTGGRGLRNRYGSKPGHERMRRLTAHDGVGQSRAGKITFDDRLTFSKLGDLHSSGTVHDEDQPVHLIVTNPEICHERCSEEYGNPCQHFCPAAVYDMQSDHAGKSRLEINASNCVHCKTCDIMDPYEIIEWIPPEGGGGPGYEYL